MTPFPEPPQDLVSARLALQAAEAELENFDSSPTSDLLERVSCAQHEESKLREQLSALVAPSQPHEAQQYVAEHIVPAELELARLEEAEAQLKHNLAEHSSTANLVIQAQERLACANAARQQLSVALTTQQPLSEVQQKLHNYRTQLHTHQSLLAHALQLRGSISAKLAVYKQNDLYIAEKTLQLREMQKQEKCWSALAHAFGRDGIPQLVADNAIPRLQHVANELLREFDQRWLLKFDTQRQTKSGVLQERFDIRVVDAHGEADISVFSGGEKHLLRAIVSISLAVLQAERTGRRLQIFVFDEAFESLDVENVQRLLSVLQRLSMFRQVFVVTHSDDLLSLLPVQLHAGEM